ncbi:MAG: carboxypeptidase-like regulatory domain-containing protein, partial [Ignavibacterium sp.]
MKKIYVSLLILFCLSQTSFSQTISGIVKDKISLKPLQNVKVTVTNLSTGLSDSVFTNSNGIWYFNLLTGMDDNVPPNEFFVSQNFPNPFNPS